MFQCKVLVFIESGKYIPNNMIYILNTYFECECECALKKKCRQSAQKEKKQGKTL